MKRRIDGLKLIKDFVQDIIWRKTIHVALIAAACSRIFYNSQVRIHL